MLISPAFVFAPIPLTSQRSPLAHAAALARRRQAEMAEFHSSQPRYRIPPALEAAHRPEQVAVEV